MQYKWNKIENNFEMSPRFGSTSNYLPIKNVLFIHGGQNFMINECYADLYKIQINIFDPEMKSNYLNDYRIKP